MSHLEDSQKYQSSEMKRIVLIIMFLSTGFSCYSNDLTMHSDTIVLHESKSGVGIHIYTKQWFFKIGEFGYEGAKMTAQDSLVLQTYDSVYFKLYDKEGYLLMEGQRLGGSSYLIGDIKFYNSGSLERIEHWAYSQHLDTCGKYVFINSEVPGKEGIWLYYSDDVLRKTVTYTIQVVSCQESVFECVRTTRYFKKNGEIKRTKEKVLWRRKAFD